MESQPTQEEVAAHIHLSQFHFQRLFSPYWLLYTPTHYAAHFIVMVKTTQNRDRENFSTSRSFNLPIHSWKSLPQSLVGVPTKNSTEYKSCDLTFVSMAQSADHGKRYYRSSSGTPPLPWRRTIPIEPEATA